MFNRCCVSLLLSATHLSAFLECCPAENVVIILGGHSKRKKKKNPNNFVVQREKGSDGKSFCSTEEYRFQKHKRFMIVLVLRYDLIKCIKLLFILP